MTPTPGPDAVNMNDDIILAAVDLAVRSGATLFQCGHAEPGEHDPGGWYALAVFATATACASGFPGPVEASDALAHQLLTGALCARCRGLIALSDDGAWAFTVEHGNGRFFDGSQWTDAQAEAAHHCRWRRHGERWQPGCEVPTVARP